MAINRTKLILPKPEKQTLNVFLQICEIGGECDGGELTEKEKDCVRRLVSRGWLKRSRNNYIVTNYGWVKYESCRKK